MYYVFAYYSYYPQGGMSDCVHKTSDKDEALHVADEYAKKSYDYVEVYDVIHNEIIWSKE